MANPNIVNVTTIYANTAVLTVTTTATQLISNPASSGKVYKINTLTVANGNTTATANVSVDYQKSGGSYVPIAGNVTVPTNSTLVVVSKDTSLYMLEGDILRCNASASVGMTAVVSFEEIS